MVHKKFDRITLKKLLVPIFCITFLYCLCGYLLKQPLPEDLESRSGLLVTAMTVTAVLLVVGSLYSYFSGARIQAYLCAVLLLVGIGFAYQFFFDDFGSFVKMTFLGLSVGVAAYLIYRRINVLSDTLFILCAVCILGLLLANLLFGKSVNGARLWIRLGSFNFQPGELVKILLILLGASAFHNPGRCACYCVLSLLSCGTLLLLHDLGGAVAIFALFVLMTYLLFDNRILSCCIITAAAIGLILALRHIEYAATRFNSWTNAMHNPDSFQQRNFIIGVLMGGFKGLGTADHGIFTRIYASQNDGALAGVLAVLGVPAAMITLATYAFLAAQPALNKSVYTSAFLIHAQLGMYLLVHVLLNFLGAIDVLPFTGVVAPLISSGGTVAICFGLLLGLGAAALDPHLAPYKEV